VTVLQQQSQNVEVLEPLFKLNAETLKLQHAKEDVLLLLHNQPQLFQTHVTVTQLQSQNVDQQELPFKLNVETVQQQLADKDVHHHHHQ
jgi:hypothetical protein